MVAGAEASGTGASTVKIPSTENVDTSLATSTSAGSLKMNQFDSRDQ